MPILSTLKSPVPPGGTIFDGSDGATPAFQTSASALIDFCDVACGVAMAPRPTLDSVFTQGKNEKQYFYLLIALSGTVP